MVFSAVLSGATGWKPIQEFGESQIDWLRQYRQFENGIPKWHCIANIISILESDALLEALFDWLNVERTRSEKSVLAIDGKTLSGTQSDDNKSALNVVFREDELKVKYPDSATLLAAFNRAALNMIKQPQGKKTAWRPNVEDLAGQVNIAQILPLVKISTKLNPALYFI